MKTVLAFIVAILLVGWISATYVDQSCSRETCEGR